MTVTQPMSLWTIVVRLYYRNGSRIYRWCIRYYATLTSIKLQRIGRGGVLSANTIEGDYFWFSPDSSTDPSTRSCHNCICRLAPPANKLKTCVNFSKKRSMEEKWWRANGLLFCHSYAVEYAGNIWMTQCAWVNDSHVSSTAFSSDVFPLSLPVSRV